MRQRQRRHELPPLGLQALPGRAESMWSLGEHVVLHTPVVTDEAPALPSAPLRETEEETGLPVQPSDLHLFAMIAEKAYEGASHWLLFLFRCTKSLDALPDAMDEGRFGFFGRARVNVLELNLDLDGKPVALAIIEDASFNSDTDGNTVLESHIHLSLRKPS